MTVGPVVCNSSPLIALEQIGRLDLLNQLFGAVLVPPAVVQEIAPLSLPVWISERALRQPIHGQIVRAAIGKGESETISLALETTATWTILDDRAARKLAQAFGLPIIGTLGVLLAAKRRGLLAAVKPSMDALAQSGFRIAPDLYKRILSDAGESP